MPLTPPKIAALTLLLFAPLARAQTLPDGWPFRRPVTFKQIPSDAPGDNIACVDFYANGTQKPDGSDLRVTTPNRTLVPFKLMQVSPNNDLIRLAFATKTDGPYYIWWGNPNPGPPAPELQIRRGILLEISRPAPPTTAPAAPQILASSLLPDLALAYNPAGDQRQMTLHYSGTFKIDPAITAQFQLAFTGTCTLSIDDKVIRIAPGRPVSVPLAAGWHSLDLRQVNPNPANPALALSWQRPGERILSPFPAALFAPAARALPGNLEKSAAPAPDIAPLAAAEIPLSAGNFAQRFTFDAAFPDSLNPTLQWSFGDGQTAAGLRKVNHIFLSPGTYPITLTLQPPTGPAQSITVRLPIQDRMFERFPRPPSDPVPTVRAVLKDYNLQRLPAEDAFRGMQFFESAKDDDLQIAWGRAWLAGTETRSIPLDDIVARETFALARVQIKKKQFADAAETFRLAAAKPIAMDTRIDFLRHEVMTLCDCANDPAAAFKEAQSWTTRITPSTRLQARTLQVSLAYAAIAAGNAPAAQAAVTGAIAPTADAYTQLTRQVDDALAKKDTLAAAALLDQWELDFALSVWDGSTRILRVKLAAAEARPLDAARMAFQHAQANPQGPYAPELLSRAADNYALAGDPKQAQAATTLLLSRYPNSPFARKIQPQ